MGEADERRQREWGQHQSGRSRTCPRWRRPWQRTPPACARESEGRSRVAAPLGRADAFAYGHGSAGGHARTCAGAVPQRGRIAKDDCFGARAVFLEYTLGALDALLGVLIGTGRREARAAEGARLALCDAVRLVIAAGALRVLCRAVARTLGREHLGIVAREAAFLELCGIAGETPAANHGRPGVRAPGAGRSTPAAHGLVGRARAALKGQEGEEKVRRASCLARERGHGLGCSC